MTELVLDREQSLQLAEGHSMVIVRDDSGRRIGTLLLTPDADGEPISLSAEAVDKIIRRAAQPTEGLRTTAEVLARLQARTAP